MKPDWKDAPKWAKFLAQDSNGDWYWYEFEPELQLHGFMCFSGHVEMALRHETNWRHTLEAKPK